MALAAASCRSQKGKSDDKSRYSSTYVDEIYGDSRHEAGTSAEEPHETSSALGDEIASWMGAPYRYGGHSRQGTDCSGMVMEVFKAVYGISLPHRSADIFSGYCEEIGKEELAEGDLVFFSFVKSGKVSHVGIYLHDGKFVHSSSSRGVIISDMSSPYYEEGFVAAGRVRGLKRDEDGSME